MSLPHILIVEDEAIIAMNIQNILAMKGYLIAGVVSSGEEAVEVVSKNKVDLILMDIILDGALDGIDTCQRIKQNSDIPVIYMTAHSDEKTLTRAKATEPHGYILKPINQNEIYSSIEIALYKHEMEQRLRESEQRYRIVSENLQDIVYSLDSRGRIDFISGALERIFGISHESIINKTFTDAMSFTGKFSPQNLEITKENFTNAIKERSPLVSYEYSIGENGDKRFIELLAKIDYDEHGNFTGCVGAISDITDRKIAEEERDRLFTLSIDMLCIAGFDGYFKQINPSWEKTLGWSPEEILNKPWLDLVHSDDLDVTVKAGEKLQKGEPVINFINRYCCKDGSFRWISWNSFPLKERNLIFGVARDVTHQKNADEALKQSEERFRSLSESSPMGVFHTDNEGKVLYTNKKWQEIAEISFEQSLGYGWAAALHPDDRENILKEWEKCLNEGRGWSGEFRFLTPSGRVKWLYTTTSPIRTEDGIVIGHVGSNEDITDRKNFEEELKKSYSHLAALMENTDDFILVSDENAKPVLFNTSYQRLMKEALGIDMKPGLQPHALIQDQAAVDFWESLHKRVLAGEKFRAEYSHQFGNGNIRHFEVSYNPIVDNGMVTGFSELTREITDRKNMENELTSRNDDLNAVNEELQSTLQELEASNEELMGSQRDIESSEEKYRALIGNLSDMILILDKNGVNIWNSPSVSQYGMEPDDAIGIDAREFVHPDDLDRVDKVLRYVVRHPGKTLKLEDLKVISKDGSLHYLDDTFTYLPDTPGIRGILVVCKNVTEKKIAEEQLQLLFDNPLFGVYVSDSAGRIIKTNEAVKKILGYPQEELLALNEKNIYAKPEERKEIQEQMQQKGIVMNKGASMKKKAGKIISAVISKKSIQIGKDHRYITTIMDITGTKK